MREHHLFLSEVLLLGLFMMAPAALATSVVLAIVWRKFFALSARAIAWRLAVTLVVAFVFTMLLWMLWSRLPAFPGKQAVFFPAILGTLLAGAGMTGIVKFTRARSK